MSDLHIAVLNGLQAIHRQIEDIIYAPAIDEYPTSMDTLRMPSILTEIIPVSLWDMRPQVQGSTLICLASCYIQKIGQGFFEIEKSRVYEFSDKFRDKYLEAATFVNEDIQTGMIVCDTEARVRAWLDTSKPFKYSGYDMIPYPHFANQYAFDPGFYAHGFTVTMTLTAESNITLC